jgi:hypothetical protein
VNRIAVPFLLAVAACHRGGDMNMDVVNATPLSSANAVAPGDCVEARRRAVAKPDLDVDVLPAPVRQSPKPFQRMPADVRWQVSQSGANVQVNVVIDTLGHADMKTFQVVQTSNPWLAQNLKSILPRWTFSSARLAGCRVARVYKFSATSSPRG